MEHDAQADAMSAASCTTGSTTMAKYLLAYRGGDNPQTEEEGARVMAAWTAWFERLGGAVVDGGNPVGATMTVAADGSASDGPADPITGYSIIEAADMATAVELARGCPILEDPTGSIEVAETFEIQM
jgi:hypothetical protein